MIIIKVIIIGGNAAGLSAASAIKKSKNIEVVVYEAGEYVSYGACGIPYFLKDDVKSERYLITLTPDKLKEREIPVFTHHKVIFVNFDTKEIQISDLKGNRTFIDTYDALVISTGAEAIKIPNISIHHPGVVHIHDLSESVEFKRFLISNKEAIRSAVIIGLGYVGLEMLEAYLANGITDLTIIGEKMIFSEEFNQKIIEHVRSKGIKVKYPGIVKRVEPIEFDRLRVICDDDEMIETDLVQVSVGVRPMTEMFKGTKLAMERNGAIIIDKFQQTNIPNVYAAGDCCVSFHSLKKKNVYMPLAPAANKQGRVAGEKIAGTETKGFPSIVGTAIFKCLDLYCALTGLKVEEAEELGYRPDFITIENREIPHYYPNSKNMHIKLIFDLNTHKILGAEIIAGSAMGAKKIDLLVAAISGGFTIEMLQDLDLAYAPPFSPVWDPILIAANVASKKLK